MYAEAPSEKHLHKCILFNCPKIVSNLKGAILYLHGVSHKEVSLQDSTQV